MLTRLAPWILATLVAGHADAASSVVTHEFSGVTNRCASIDVDPIPLGGSSRVSQSRCTGSTWLRRPRP